MMFRNRNRHLSGEPGKLPPSRVREDEHKEPDAGRANTMI